MRQRGLGARRAARGVLAGLVVSCLALSCATNPVTGKKQLALISEAQAHRQLMEAEDQIKLDIRDAMRSLVERDNELAEATIAFDHRINRMEIELDEKCLQVLALRQPAARDPGSGGHRGR